MKKIVSLLSASVLALSLIGCSGDLHDTDVSPLFIEGDCWGTRTALAFDGDEQVIEFKYEDNADCKKWGGSAGTVNFKITTEAVGWNDDFGAPKDETLELKINDDFVETHSRKNEGIGGLGPGNIVLKDLAVGSTYKVHVKYDSAANTAKIKVTGNVTDYPNLRVIVGEKEYSMTRKGSTYKYIYTPEQDGSFDYYITNGFLYWDENGKVVAESDKKIYTLNYKFSKLPDGSTQKYLIRVDASKLPNVTVTSTLYNPTVLGEAAFVGTVPGFDWNGTKMLTDYLASNDYSTYEYEFTADSDSYQFSIQENAGSWATRWCGQNAEAKNASGDWIKDNPIEIEAPNTVGSTGTEKTLTYISSSSGDPAHTSLKVSNGSKYKLIIKLSNSKTVSAALKLVEAAGNQNKIEKVDLTGFIARGLFGEWDSTTKYALNKNSDGTFSVDFNATATETNCKIANDSWTKSYPADVTKKGGSKESWAAEISVGADAVECDNRDTGTANPKLTGMTIGENYTLICTPLVGKISIKLVKKD